LEFDPNNLTLTQHKENLPVKRSQFEKAHGIDLFVTVMCITKHGFSEVVGTYFPMDIVNLVMELFYLLV
jgi:hypothetical protein